jgi:carboxymethylenebutenolidase
VFRPDSGAAPWPAVLFFMDAVGIRPAMFEVAERIANHGYFVLLPDLFYRGGEYVAPNPTELFGNPDARQAWFSKFYSTVTNDNMKADIEACLQFLGAQSDVVQPKVGTTGYCMGGRLSLTAAGYFPERIAAAASYHGGGLATDSPDSPHLLAPHIKARVYIAGAVEDSSFSDEQKQRLIDALVKANVDHTVETYEGCRHGWVPADFPVHDAAATERHYRTLFALLDGVLRKS